MPLISKLAMQMIFLFVLACAVAVASNWKHKMMSSTEVDWTGAVRANSSTPNLTAAAGEPGSHTQTQSSDIDPVARIAE
ncbi:hypothetical protein [Pseudomonas fluorescens]|uniref:Lipoprotein n=1 Tax=Pseudomonas fluorescens TaxID=294 RepID=A0A5E7DHU4_PSEFL|nr:hypothetical protein [Pseudomonas fluorescens]VVO17077.1 hypothetical protein PS691_03881 [Pseudomonas fluorescens]